MRINYDLDTNNYIVGYTIIPFNPALPSLEIESESQIHIGISQVIGGEFVPNDERYAEVHAAAVARNAITTEIATLKGSLAKTDYEAIKFAEGEMTAEEFEPYKVQRHQWRLRIRELESQLEEAE